MLLRLKIYMRFIIVIYVGRNLMRNNSGLHALAHTKMMVNFGDDNFKKWPVINVFVYNYQLVPTHIYVVGVVFIAITIHYTSHFHDNFRRWLTRGVSDESGYCELWTERLQKKSMLNLKLSMYILDNNHFFASTYKNKVTIQ